MMSSVGIDYDGDGNTSEGIYDELVGLRDKAAGAASPVRQGARHADLLFGRTAIPTGSSTPTATAPARPPRRCPRTGSRAGPRAWCGPAYNFQLASKDPGAFAHNAKYVIELLHDAVADVNTGLVAKVDLSKAVRNDVGHFNGASEAARHWDSGEQVDATCSGCHGGQEGFRFYVQYGVGHVVPETANGLECQTCHDKSRVDSGHGARRPVGEVPERRRARRAGARQPVRDLPPRPRGEGDRRRADRDRQAQSS